MIGNHSHLIYRYGVVFKELEDLIKIRDSGMVKPIVVKSEILRKTNELFDIVNEAKNLQVDLVPVYGKK